MKGMFKMLTFFYILFPLALIPLMASRSGNWFYLFGIVCYYLGVLLVAIRQKIIFMIPLLFCGWFWYTYGFGIHDYVFFLFMCMLAGAVFYQLAQNARHFTQSVLPENKEAQEYELKIVEMNDKLKAYQQQHPSTIITPEIIDTIRNEVFFK